jgi:hypothetical protein
VCLGGLESLYGLEHLDLGRQNCQKQQNRIKTMLKLHKFKDFDTFYEALLPSEKSICLRLRHLISDNFPEWREKFGYGVPYYHRRSRICFIYPASFPYSGQAAGVAFGFTRGHLLSNEQGLLDMGERKEVAYARLLLEKDIRENELLEILHEAVLLDEEFHLEKTKKNKP